MEIETNEVKKDTTEKPATNFQEMSKEINEIALALSKAQLELESVDKAEEGYGYNYASLTDTIKMAKPILHKHDLAVTQLIGMEGDKPSITTMLIHSSGQFIKSKASLPLVEMKGCNEAQRAGAVFSYLRRYALQAILNMSSEDNDASSQGYSKPQKQTSYSKGKSAKSTSSEDKPVQKFRRKKKPSTKQKEEHDI